MHTILVADDDEGVRKLVTLSLGAAGYTVISARNGKDALELLEREAVDLVITDLTMPEMDGKELSAEVRKRYGVPVVLVSGDRKAALRADVLAAADACLLKPFSIRDLTTTVRLLTLRSGMNELRSRSS